MSSGLMSCVRDNSPPLELNDATAAASSGPLSLPAVNDTSIEIVGERSSSTMASNAESGDGGAAPNSDQHKKRRFHPLRNLRRIFRRRTITSVSSDAPVTGRQMNTLPTPSTQANSNSEKNLRSTMLNPSMSSVASVSASSPSSPLTHQQLQDAYNSQSLPKPKTFAIGPHLQRDGRGKYQQTLQRETHGESSTDYDIMRIGSATNSSYQGQGLTQAHPQPTQRISMGIGVAVLPPIGATRGRNFFAERKPLRSIGDSSRELDSNENDSGPSGVRRFDGRTATTHNGSPKSSEISDSQRSLSEGRLVDSDYSREGLSQSHDSVFSESATASSLSIVMRAELANVLRKRTRPDGSDEDLGLPRSPGSPQRRTEQSGHSARPTNTTANNTNQSEVSSVSLLSMNSTECEEFQATSTANNSMEQQQTERIGRYTRSATFSSMPSEILRHPTMSTSFNENAKDEVDLFNSDWQRLSHSAAKHKMAIRPIKKNVPTRQQRRHPLQNSIPEAIEEFKASNSNRLEITNVDVEAREKSRSLPPGVNAKVLEQHAGQDVPKIDKNVASSSSTTASMNALSKNITDSTATISAASIKPKLLSETCSSTTKFSTSSSSSSVAKLFGLRAFSGKSSSNVESESKNSTTSTTTIATITTGTTVTATESQIENAENSEGGFLRRLMQRNSKRNYAKANTSDELDKNVVSEPKKMPISTSCFEITPKNHDDDDDSFVFKSKSAMSYEQSINETRKDIKREIMNEGKVGLSAFLNNYITPECGGVSCSGSRASGSGRQETLAPSAKPKSGPAARQRYVPQDLTISNTLIDEEKSNTPAYTNTNTNTTTLTTLTTDAIPEQETLKSTTILHGITKSTAAATTTTHPTIKSSPTKTPHRGNGNGSGKDTNAPQHHFEKKPKIVGLSAFQQKISRSNDSVVRISASNNSLETCIIDNEQQAKQRATVEKSRSFRTYTEEQRESSSSSSSYANARNNMPSLPDLSLNLRAPISYMHEQHPQSKPTEKCVSLGYEISDPKQSKKTKKTNSQEAAETFDNLKTTSKRVSPNLARAKDVDTMDVNIQTTKDMRPNNSVTVIKPQGTTAITIETETETDSHSYKRNVNVVQSVSVPKRPNSLALSGKTKSEEQLKMTPVRSISNTSDETAVVGISRIKQTLSASTKEIDRKSAPAPSTSSNSLRIIRHSASLNENLQETQQTTQSTSSTSQPGRSDVPEFMKIQLNHIDQEQRFTVKGNVVFAKNVKENLQHIAKPKVSPRTLLNDGSSITETQTGVGVGAIEEKKQPNDNAVRKDSNEQQPPPRSPIKNSTSPIDSPSDIEVILREKSDIAVTQTASINKISLQDRMRLFMADSGDKEKKIDEIRSERKKSLSEEVARRLSTYGRVDEKATSLINCDNKLTPTASPPPISPTSNGSTKQAATPSPTETNHVILRKKSFGLSTTAITITTATTTTTTNATTNTNNNVHKDDSTPELMKVFARRSLKVKDEDIAALTDKHLSGIKKITTTTTATATTATQSVDSDKENQSSSEEKLNKISVDLEEMTAVTKISNHNLQATTNRNSGVDFRNGLASKAISNNNNNNNNGSSKCSQLPPIKTNNNNNSNGFRATISNGVNERNTIVSTKMPKLNTTNGETHSNHNSNSNNTSNNNNNNNNSNSNGNSSSIKRSYERQSLNIKTLDSVTTAAAAESPGLIANKTIERSATISEFKGIDQRRREWELRAKEAFK